MINLQQYNTIIFDFGGVILNIDPNLTINKFSEIFGKQQVQEVVKSKVLHKYEKGELSSAEFYNKVCAITQKTVDKELFFNSWNKMLLDYLPERLNKLNELKETHKLILLSNTNECHFNYFENKLLKDFNIRFEQIFSSLYLSYKLKMIKPELEIFKYLVNAEKLTPEKTLFIEDTLENAKEAEKIGIQTLVIDRNSNFYEYFL